MASEEAHGAHTDPCQQQQVTVTWSTTSWKNRSQGEPSPQGQTCKG